MPTHACRSAIEVLLSSRQCGPAVRGERPGEGGPRAQCDAVRRASIQRLHPPLSAIKEREGPGPRPAQFEAGCSASECRRVRDARPQGRDTGAHARARRKRGGDGERRGLGAVGNSCIVGYGARSPTRSAAEGHAQKGSAKVLQHGSAKVRKCESAEVRKCEIQGCARRQNEEGEPAAAPLLDPSTRPLRADGQKSYLMRAMSMRPMVGVPGNGR